MMKKTLLLSVPAIVLMMTAGCTKEENVATPVLTPAVETVEAEAAGGAYEVAYQIENPVDGADIQPTSNEDWITGCTVSDGTLSFEVLPNISDGEVTEARDGKVTVVYSYSSGAASFSVNVAQAGSNQTPSLAITSDTVMNVLSNTYRHTVHYTLSGKVDGGELRAYSDVDWITEPDTQAADSVNFMVNVNTSDEQREGRLYLEYSWPDGKRTESVRVVQESGHIVFDAPMIEGFYYGKTVDPKNNQYFFYFTDNGFDEFGYAYPNSLYINIDLRIDDNPNLYELGIPEGDYEFIEKADEFPSGTFTTQNGYIVNGEVYVDDAAAFSSGTLTVRRDGAHHDMTLDAVLSDGRHLHATYSGENVVLTNSSGEIPSFSGDVNLTPTECFAELYTTQEGTERPDGGYAVWFYFADSKNKADGTPADMAVIYTFLDTDEYYRLLAPEADMPVSEDMASAPGTVLSGFTATYLGSFAAGSYIIRYDDQNRPYYQIITDGSMSMSVDENGFYSFDLNFTGPDGDAITGKYTGPVRLTGRPGALSTADRDFTMELSGISTAKAVRNGGSKKTSSVGNWQIEILPEYGTAADGMTIEICTGVDSDDLSTIAGTYKADITGAAGTFVIGQWWVTGHSIIRIDGMEGTGYVGNFTSDGLACEIAPAIDGEIVITENQDGTFTIEMKDLIDDHEPAFTFGGTWTGRLEFVQGSDSEGDWTVHAPAGPGYEPADAPVCIGYGDQWRF